MLNFILLKSKKNNLQVILQNIDQNRIIERFSIFHSHRNERK